MRYKIKRIVNKHDFSSNGVYWAPPMDYLDGYVFNSEEGLNYLQKHGTMIDTWVISGDWIFMSDFSNGDLMSLKEIDVM